MELSRGDTVSTPKNLSRTQYETYQQAKEWRATLIFMAFVAVGFMAILTAGVIMGPQSFVTDPQRNDMFIYCVAITADAMCVIYLVAVFPYYYRKQAAIVRRFRGQ